MDIHQILIKYWGHTEFRPLQEDIITNVLEGKDTLALLPTGGGKSICFQVPALAKEGICVVISPLIALMKDQVENLLKRNIKAAAIFSGMTNREIDITLDNCVYGNYKFLYVSPERIETDLFKARLEKMNVNLFAIDESHCISQWGYDFRPSYLNIAKLREYKPDVPFLALTATATSQVVGDIQEKLKFKKENVLQKSFERKNIAYVVIYEEDKYKRLLRILNKIKGTSVVYVGTRKRTKEIAQFLVQQGVSADYYHAGLSNHERSAKQNNWITNKTRVIVSTNAFGMGIDKPDVRTVVHLDLPNSLEAYFQEAGRAGRDEEKAYAVLLVEQADRLELEKQIINSFPEIETIKTTYQALANFFQIPIGSALNESYFFDINTFSKQYNFQSFTVYNCLKFLEKEGYLMLSEANYNPSRVKIEINKNDLYDFQLKNPTIDIFIKTLLRSHSGLFEEFVKIDEFDLAKKLKTTREKIIKVLDYLLHLNIISYTKQTDLPQITFLTPRVETKSLYISRQHYSERKEVSITKMESVIYYAYSKHKCRSQILLGYFGETNSYRCGVCDVCLERNKLELSDVEFSNVSDQIKKILGVEHLPITALVNKIKGVREDKVIKVIQWLTENEKLMYNDKNLLEWRK
ncbi:MAG: RecQ family ATP-dependent DNA helicase [Flavobacteriales bacterium]|nr:RecQ family ATP-dependent DNA helicase [Flavobacteriales bacterium]